MKSSKQAALLGCSLSVAALASVRGHHGQVICGGDGDGDGGPQFVVVMLVMGHHCQTNTVNCKTHLQFQNLQLMLTETFLIFSSFSLGSMASSLAVTSTASKSTSSKRSRNFHHRYVNHNHCHHCIHCNHHHFYFHHCNHHCIVIAITAIITIVIITRYELAISPKHGALCSAARSK